MIPTPDTAAGRMRLNLALYVLALVAAAACVVVSVAVVREVQDDGPAALPASEGVQVERLDEAPAEEQERFAEVIDAASAVATAFTNIRYDDAQASIARVQAGATGEFRAQYEKSSAGVIEVLKRNKSVMTGEVLWAGVVDAGDDSATVIVATTGTVANTQSDQKPIARNFRLKLDLVKEGDSWLTNNLEFVA